MAESIDRGVVKSGILPASRIRTAHSGSARRTAFEFIGITVFDNNTQVVEDSDVIICSVKPQVGLLPERYVLEKQAGVLLEELWAECEGSSEDKLLEVVEKESLLHSAEKAGNGSQSINRKLVRWNVILQQLFQGTRYITQTQSLEEEEKILLPSFLKVSGAALQMQGEILWFKMHWQYSAQLFLLDRESTVYINNRAFTADNVSVISAIRRQECRNIIMESQPTSHDIELVALDNEQFGSRDGSDIENQPPIPVLFLNGRKLNYRKACQILCQAAMKDEWRFAEPILKMDPSFVRETISKQGETILHLAAAARSTRFLRELIKLMEVDDLELKNRDGNTAFLIAAATGMVEIAKAMWERNKNLPNIRDEGTGLLPIEVAALYGYKPMVSYLFEVTSLDVLSQGERLHLLQATTQSEMYDVALNIFNKDRKLASKILPGNVDVLHILAQKSLAISNQVVAYSPWRKFVTNAISMATRQFIPWLLLERDVLERQAGLLLGEVWAECERSSEEQLLEVVEKESLLHSAAKAGNVEFLAVIFRNYPDLIWQVDNQNWTIFHVAVSYRQEKVFSLIRQLGEIKKLPAQTFDIYGNNILHLAGKLGQPIHKQNTGQCTRPNTRSVILQQLWQGPRYITETQSLKKEDKIMLPSFLKVSGAALQMQREILWFKEVEKIVPSALHKLRNNDGKTPRELFTQEHKLLLKEGERWMKDTANSCMIVATLIATMVFSAGFTVPGGNNDDDGIPVLLKLNGFTIFVISDALALFSSIVSIIMFLSILTSRYAEDDFLVSLPVKLLFGLTTLFVSIVSMLLAFAATFFLVHSNHMGNWEPKLIVACVGVPVALFGSLQYKLWFDVVKSTYSSKFLFRPGKHKLY